MPTVSRHVQAGQFQENVREYAFAAQQGNLLEVKVKLSHSQNPSPELRKAVKGFSPAARLRLLKTIARIDWEHLGRSSFLTLTYPDKYLTLPYAARTSQRSRLMRSLEGYVGGRIRALWRVEFKPRQSGKNKGQIGSHLHVLMMDVPYIPKGFITQAWRRVLGHVGYVHTHIREAETGEKAAMYAAKYAAKAPSLGSLVNASYLNIGGRSYGYHRKSDIPMHRCREMNRLTDEQVDKAMWIAERELGRWWIGSFCLLGKGALNAYCQIAGKSEKEIDE